MPPEQEFEGRTVAVAIAKHQRSVVGIVSHGSRIGDTRDRW
jgi:hypothetical protein